jgi:hypothetical protein
LSDFFRLALGLKISPVILMLDLSEELQPRAGRPAELEPILGLVPAFGSLLQKRVPEGALADFAAAAELHPEDLRLKMRGYLSPTLPEFFRIARALQTEPTLLLIDLIKEWQPERSAADCLFFHHARVMSRRDQEHSYRPSSPRC